MSATQHLTPEGFRTAAYLEARARLDARKTRRNIKCNPPNIQCGNRCIPPTWDCRLKNQGADPHLQAVKTDPLGGLANIERGTKRIVKGLAKGSFSEVEGGKRAIIRGTVKITPGNIQQKRELKAKLERRTYAIGVGLAVVTGGLGIHTILMKNNTFGYRNGVGRDINSAVRNGVTQVLDAVPILGAQRQRTRTAVSTANAEAAYRSAFESVAGPGRLTETLGTGGERQLPRTPATRTLLDSHSALQTAVRQVDREFTANPRTVNDWDAAHRQAFWGATVVAPDLGAGRQRVNVNVFARPAAEDYLARQFGIDPSGAQTTSALKTAIQERLAEEHRNLISLAKQRGYRTLGGRSAREYLHGDSFQPFVREVVSAAGITSPTIRQRLEDHVTSVLRQAPSSYTNQLYRESVLGFNDYYNSVAQTVANNAVLSSRISRLSDSANNIQQSSDLLRATFLARSLNRRENIAGAAHAELIRRTYYSRRVAGTNLSSYTVTERLAVSAARELTGRTDIIGVREAYRILLEDFDFTGLVPPSPPARRRRSDAASPEVVRSASYLKTKQQLADKGKPCGESFIPKNHECRKQRRNQALKIAAGVGAVALGAYAIKKARLGEFHTGIAIGDPAAPTRKRRFNWEKKNQPPTGADAIANAVSRLKDQPGVVNDNVDAFAKFVKNNDTHSNAATMVQDLRDGAKKAGVDDATINQGVQSFDLLTKLGALEGFATPFGNNIYVRSKRSDPSTLNPDPQEMTAAVNRFMDRRAAAPGPQKAEAKEEYRLLFNVDRNTKSGDVSESLTYIHEVAHQVHFRASEKAGASLLQVAQGQVYSPPSPRNVTEATLRDSLFRAASEYGRSDVYGKRCETFAELSVLYVTQGERFRREHPIAYDWVDTIWKKGNE